MSDVKSRSSEKIRLRAVQMAFEDDVKARLFQKVDEGYGGWEEMDWDIEARIDAEVEKLKAATDLQEIQRRCADLAAFAMFRWYRATDKKEI
jgi:hypothetical protein